MMEFLVDADYLALKRLLNILLENSWRYTPCGQSVVLAVSDCPQVIHPRAVEVSLTDTGIGISSDDQRRIFQRFCHIARPVHGDYSGSGLGLALGQWIAERHNTKIDLQSTLGEGSRFSFLLPICLPDLKRGLPGTVDDRSRDNSRSPAGHLRETRQADRTTQLW